MIGQRRSFAAAATGWGLGKVCGIPGLSTSAAGFVQCAAARSVTGTPACSASARLAGSSSQAQTSAPDAASARAATRPDLASPSTATVLPAYEGSWIMTLRSPQLQRGEAGQGQDGGDDPETDDDGGLRPALLLEVVVQRRHLEDALAG